MFLSAIEPYIVVTLIIIIAVQYAIALFCLLKLAYLDIDKRTYVLWNLFILLVFFIGDIAFLIYYYKVGKNNRIPEKLPAVNDDTDDNEESNADTADNNAEDNKTETETADDKAAEEKVDTADIADDKAEDNKPETDAEQTAEDKEAGDSETSEEK